MKCDEAAEYVSALCDGVTVPRTAAEHIDACENCRGRLKEYVELGAELRRAASLEIAEAPAPPAWPKRRKGPSIFWQKGWKTMRIPRLAFVSLLAAVVVLASGWVLTGVRANTKGSVLLVQYTLGDNAPWFCALSAVDRKLIGCTVSQNVKSGQIVWQLKLLSKNGDQATVGVRAKYIPRGQAWINPNDLPQQQYTFTPGETVHVNVSGVGSIDITGQWIDHIPAIKGGRVGANHELDPGPEELRFISPLLLRVNKLIGDLQGFSATTAGPDAALDVFLKGEGRFTISVSPLPRAVEGKVDFNRISFAINGKPYVFVSGAPITRSQTVWVRYDPKPPAWDPAGNSLLGSGEISKLLPGTR
jgi:hypothetical protein